MRFEVIPFILLPTCSTSDRFIVGLAESLRNELILFDVSVHLFLPATIHSPGFAKEQLLKPEIAKKIEGPDEGKSCDDVARELIKGELCFPRSKPR